MSMPQRRPSTEERFQKIGLMVHRERNPIEPLAGELADYDLEDWLIANRINGFGKEIVKGAAVFHVRPPE